MILLIKNLTIQITRFPKSQILTVTTSSDRNIREVKEEIKRNNTISVNMYIKYVYTNK